MGLPSDFPTDPYAILKPESRWFPGDTDLAERGYGQLLPPLVHEIRKGVSMWRQLSYDGASPVTVALLNYWFNEPHAVTQANGQLGHFRYYFAQREAVESAIWLYEVEKARNPYALGKYDSSGLVSTGMFPEDWTRYVMKLATGAGKTKVMSLLVAWSYFHKCYEASSDLSKNFLVVAPNIIVLDRLRTDFESGKIFFSDPIIPPNGYKDRNWKEDFQLRVHIQDQVEGISDSGNLFLTNIHRVFLNEKEPSFQDNDTTEYFLGSRPSGDTNESKVDLGKIIRSVKDLVVLNDEAHHVHDESLAWFKNIQDISNRLKESGSKLSAQFDVSATPKHNDGGIFVQTISDYPLVEAIRQGVVKTPVIPDQASRSKLRERSSDNYSEQYKDYLHLGYLEWKKVYDVFLPMEKKAILFVMTDDTKNCDEVAAHLEKQYPELRGAVLVIHTKDNGDVLEGGGSKNKEELDLLRLQSREIDKMDNKYKAVVSVMVLREGWDVQNVVSIVGLRPFKAKSQILPEQTLGRGLRRMFRGSDVVEKVSVIGTQAFMDFVESIKAEGIEFEKVPMGEGTAPKAPIVIQVDRDNVKKDIEALDIELPVLSARIYREYKNLSELTVDQISKKRILIKAFTEEQQREIVFKDIDKESVSHVTVMNEGEGADYRSVLAFFTNTIMRDLRLVGGADTLFGKVKEFTEEHLFEKPVDLEDMNIIRNLSEVEAVQAIVEGFKSAINRLTVQDKGSTEIRDWIRFSKTRPFIVIDQEFFSPKKSIFNRIVGDSGLELKFANFLDGCNEIESFIKNSQSTVFKIEYRTKDGSIANYFPDFIVKEDSQSIWVIETKGREDMNDVQKWARLQTWCADACEMNPKVVYSPMLVKEEDWDKYRPKNFSELKKLFGVAIEKEAKSSQG